MVKLLRQLLQWEKNVSKHTPHIEKRAMSANIKPHESVTMLMGKLVGFMAREGDLGWVMRGFRDEATDLVQGT